MRTKNYNTREEAPAPPNLREADDDDESCGSCKMFDSDKSVCWGYGNHPVEPDQVCDSYSPEERMATSTIEVDVAPGPGFAELRKQITDLKAQLDELRSPALQVLNEPLTYEARLVRDNHEDTGFRAVSLRDDYSYCADLAMHQLRMGDWRAAEERLKRHAKEMSVLGKERKNAFAPDVSVSYERRAVSWASGSGGYFAPPAWIVEAFAITPTPERVLSRLAPKFELPMGAQSINLPRWTAAATTTVPLLNAPVSVVDIADTAISSPVATIAGQADVPLQMLEQSPVGAHLDWATFVQLESQYGSTLELQMLAGAGVATPQGSGNNQLRGILNNTDIPSSHNIVYTDATPTVNEMINIQSTKAGGGCIPQAVAAIGNDRKVKPEIWMMTTSRAAWVTSSEVSFPLALANQTAPGAFDLLAYPVHQNDAIPVNIGGTGQDTIICCRPSDWLVLESEPRTNVYKDVLSGALMARIQLRRFAAALLRQPTSVAYITGTGVVVQTTLGL